MDIIVSSATKSTAADQALLSGCFRYWFFHLLLLLTGQGGVGRGLISFCSFKCDSQVEALVKQSPFYRG